METGTSVRLAQVIAGRCGEVKATFSLQHCDHVWAASGTELSWEWQAPRVPKDEEGVSGREEGFSQCLHFSPSRGGTSLGEQEHVAGPSLPVKTRSRG